MRRMVLVPLLIIVAFLAIAGGVIYYIYDSYTFYRTDDAQVTGSIVSVSAPASGQLTALSVKVGDNVTANQIIGTITTVPTATTTTGANGGAASAPITIDLKSPIDGRVVQAPAVQGQTVAPGLTLVQLTNLGSLTVTAYVDESQLSNVKNGQDVDIHIDAYSDTTFSGKVQQIVSATQGSFSLIPNQDPSSGNFTKVGQRIPVIVSIDNTSKYIVPGLSAEVTIHIH